MPQVPNVQTICYSNLNQSGEHYYHIEKNNAAFHEAGLLNLMVKGHVTGNILKAIAADYNYPTQITQIRHLAVYENYTRPKNTAEASWHFTGYSLHPLHKIEVINGRAVTKEAHFVEFPDHFTACSSKPVPVTALYYADLKSPRNSTAYLDALIELDLQLIKNKFGELPAPQEITQFVYDCPLDSFERPLLIEVMDKATRSFVYATLPSTDIESVLAQIKNIAATGLYGDNKEIEYNPNGKPYVSLSYDSQNIDFNQYGDFGDREYLVQRLLVSMKRGYALNINQLDNDRSWFEFSRNVLDTGLYVELKPFTETDFV